jgi:threonine dehydrogenase-like Zn-dependent dehydrogenase
VNGLRNNNKPQGYQSMRKKMRAIVWDGNVYPESLTYQDWDIPTPKPGWVLFGTKAVGICGSDVHLIRGNTRSLVPDDNLPAILGHENAGVVVEVGTGVTQFKPGDRIAVEPIHGCTEFGGSCPMCRSGKYHLCRSGITHVGVPLTRMIPGGFGEYSVAHESRVFPIPNHVSFEEAALLDVLAVNVHAARIGNPGVGTTAAVVGCGVVGLNMIQCLRAEGVTHIIAVAKYDFQGALARRLGAGEVIIHQDGGDPVAEVMRLTDGWGVDQVYECVGGQTDAVDQSIAMCSDAGNVIMLGGTSQPRPIDLQRLLLKEVNILSSNSYSTYGHKREFQIALDMLCDGQVDHKSLVTHTFSPMDYRQAFDVAINKGSHQTGKVMFVRD